MNEPLVSIITAVRNGERFIHDTINSVLSQAYDNIEYIIIDGASTDNTLSIINEYKDRVSKIISEPDKGPADAVNKGLALAGGDIIGLLNADDYLAEGTIRQVVECFNGYHPDIVCGDTIRLERDTGKITERRRSEINNMHIDMTIQHPTCYVRKEVYQKFKYNEHYKIAWDYECFTRMIRAGCTFYYCPDDIVYFRGGGLCSRFGVHFERFKIQWKYYSRIFALYRLTRKVCGHIFYSMLRRLGIKK